MNKNDFGVGDQISFVYNGGTRPGAIRIVDVKNVGNTAVFGFDHYSKQEKNFSFVKMVNVKWIYKVDEKPSIDIALSNQDRVAVWVDFKDRSIRFDFTEIPDNESFSIDNQKINSLEDLKKIVNNLN